VLEDFCEFRCEGFKQEAIDLVLGFLGAQQLFVESIVLLFGHFDLDARVLMLVA
jgi:hypothetical protein